MATNSVSRRVAQKEVQLFFSSPVAWLFLVCFASVCLFVFFWVESFFARNVADVRPLFKWMPILLIFLSAALTMRMWSEERRNGTLEHILTQPQGLWRFVLGKFRACYTLLLLALACTIPLPLSVELIADLDWGPVVGGYLATALLGGAYLSVGLYVSARTDNPIVSLIGTVVLCSLLYLLGNGLFTSYFSDDVANLLRLGGSGARFESITRGVLDARDLFYYLSLILIFLTLNIYVLEKERWAQSVSTARHKKWRAITILIICNAVLLNVWLGKINNLRLDLTQGQLYSISGTTKNILGQLREPLLIRGYFSERTHPSLASLAPQLRDLVLEYEAVGKYPIRVDFVDPAENPELEKEANERFGISATPFQVNDRYQSALVNSYFDLLIQYGDEYETLGFSDLIEVKAAGTSPSEVRLRNPEYDITRAIKRALYNYKLSGDPFEGIDEELEFVGYVSNDDLLPPLLVEYRREIEAQLEEIAQYSRGKLGVRFIEPEAQGGDIARQIRDEWGFKPMVAELSDEEEFFFYLTLANRKQVVQLPTDSFDPERFRAVFDAALQRFGTGLTRTVALVVPEVNPQMSKYKLGAPTYGNLERVIARDHQLVIEDLRDGAVAAEADLLVVAGPYQMSELEVFAIDQFLMRGGTIILVTSPFSAEVSGGQIRMQAWDSGLEPWLAHHGINISKSLVLDEQNAAFPAPVKRETGGHTFQDVQMLNYPYFVDLRPGGLAKDHPVTATIPQVTMAWASPVTVERDKRRRYTTLLRSSEKSRGSTNADVMPNNIEEGLAAFGATGPSHPHDLGIVVEGRFDSWFAGKTSPAVEASAAAGAVTSFGGTIEHSPESARLMVFTSNDFLDDQILRAVVAASGTEYLGPLELLLNAIDWSLQDDTLLPIRSRAHFNRTLPSMQRQGQKFIEYANYAMALGLLLIIACIHWLHRRYRKRYYRQGLDL